MEILPLPLPLRLHDNQTILSVSRQTPSLYDYIPTGQPSSPSVSLFLTTNPPPPAAAASSSSCSCASRSSGSGSASCSCSSSTSFNQSSNLTVGQPASPKNDNTSFGQPSHSPLPTAANITVPAGASRGGLNVLEKIGIAIAVIVVLLAIFIAVFQAFKKASQNDNGNDLGAGSIDIHSYRTAQLANPGGNSLEVDIIDIRTHTVEELNSLEVGIDIRTYTMDELKNATDNFTTKVGQGASGFVYRAKLPGNRLGAVKRATNLDTDLFKQELSVLLRLQHHPQFVYLIGLCLQAGFRYQVPTHTVAVPVERFETDASWYALWFDEGIAESQASWSRCHRVLESVMITLDRVCFKCSHFVTLRVTKL